MKIKATIIIGIAAIILSGCTHMGNLFRQDKNLSNQHTICKQLERKIIFYKTDQNLNIQWNSPTKRAHLYQQYQRYNCAQQKQENK